MTEQGLPEIPLVSHSLDVAMHMNTGPKWISKLKHKNCRGCHGGVGPWSSAFAPEHAVPLMLNEASRIPNARPSVWLRIFEILRTCPHVKKQKHNKNGNISQSVPHHLCLPGQLLCGMFEALCEHTWYATGTMQRSGECDTLYTPNRGCVCLLSCCSFGAAHNAPWLRLCCAFAVLPHPITCRRLQ